MHTVREISPEEQSPIVLLLFFVLALLLGSLIGNGLVLALCSAWGIDLQELLHSLNGESPFHERQFVRYANLISHFMTFTAPSLAFAIFFYRKKWASFLSISRSPKVENLALGTLLIISSFGLAQFVLWLNQQLPLPKWATQIEDTAANMIEGLLVMNNPFELAMNLFVMAVLPAVGEELLFRGVIQRKLENLTNRPHLTIWITAIIFSAFHLQFEGFFPRLMLGGILGYLFYWTRNLWVPIAAHFVFNGMQVIVSYFYKTKLEGLELDKTITVNWVATILSVVLVTGISYTLIKRNKQSE